MFSVLVAHVKASSGTISLKREKLLASLAGSVSKLEVI